MTSTLLLRYIKEFCIVRNYSTLIYYMSQLYFMQPFNWVLYPFERKVKKTCLSFLLGVARPLHGKIGSSITLAQYFYISLNLQINTNLSEFHCSPFQIRYALGALAADPGRLFYCIHLGSTDLSL